MRELALRLFRGRTDTGKFPWAGPGPMCLRTNARGKSSFMWSGGTSRHQVEGGVRGNGSPLGTASDSGEEFSCP